MAYASLDNLKLPDRPLHLAIGMFDGVHLGHQSVIEAAVNSAASRGGLSGVLTFWPHPSRLFRPEGEATRLFMPLNQKEASLVAMGVDCVITQPFTPEFAAITAEDFPGTLKQKLPTLTAIYVGENFRYGKGRKGTIETLIKTCRGLGLHVFSAERLRVDGEPISSTRIRACLEAGEMAQANALLGYPYTSTGRVIPGRQLGRTLGFPTLNLPWEPELRPRYGVYAVRARESVSEKWIPGVANYGQRPTVEREPAAPLLEVHLLEPVKWSAGTALEVQWMHFLRPEMKFSGLDELKARIAQDRDEAAAYFRRPSGG
ncbi:riboflavin biosynthesis protein RibF [Ruficoccus amylovorans]|uniref:Riboflavin biosynthesis protein n=1 Tax=Ruficoccus amylovorans TaxID=1804625 RepID=A0A842HAV9_9BACT|nr:riboflavin biosynthesis protein RibF [Ruficoccus amylovorans]MBC2593613.1 riboflavin biosynthesis protein RibF [Ruficoccus amylovorans]